MTRGRILIVKPVLPYPPEQGTKVLSFAMIESLAQEYDVTLLARILGPSEAEHARALERWCTRVVTVLPANRRGFAARVVYKVAYSLRSFATRRSLKSLYDCPGSLVACARSLAAEPFDLVIVEYWQLFPLLEIFPRASTVLLTHDIDQAVNRDRALLERNPVRRLTAMMGAALERREETRAYRRASRVWALTADDARAVTRLSGGTEADVLPFGLPESAFVRETGARDSREVLFIGAMGAVFNRDALAHFVRDLHPALASIPGVRFTIVGGALPPEVGGFGSRPGVTVAGHTADPGVFLRRAACLLVPLRFGGGLRIRIIEAMAAGLPVVCSPVAVAGMELEEGREVLVARTPGEYRRWIELLLADPAFAARVAKDAREAAWQRFGPSARGEGIRRLARETAARSLP